MFALIHFNDQLANSGPIIGADPEQDIQLAFLDINLEQINLLDALLGQDAG
jgi:hypothetical protein